MTSTFRWASVTAVCILVVGQGCAESPTAPQPVDPPASLAKVKSLAGTELVRPVAWGEGPTWAAAVSDKGQVVGTYAPPSGWPSKGFSWDKGNFIDLGDFWPRDVNDKGQMIGYGGLAGQVLWDNGVVTTLPGPAAAINNLGHVAGTLDANGHPYLWRDGIATDLGSVRIVPPYAFDYSQVIDVNDNDQVVAVAGIGYYYDPYRAFLWDHGTWTDLGTAAPDDYGSSLPAGINNNGQVVGLATSASYSDLPFLWQAGVMTTIGSFPGFSSVVAIDDHGVVAGGCFEMVGSVQRSFPCLYYNGGLTELAAAESSFTQVVDMSSKGKFIVGTSQSVGASDRPVVWSR